MRIEPLAKELSPLDLRVPGDVSAAAFWMVAAALHPDAELLVPGVGVNPTRSGIIDVLRDMGADLEVMEERHQGGEPVADQDELDGPPPATVRPPLIIERPDPVDPDDDVVDLAALVARLDDDSDDDSADDNGDGGDAQSGNDGVER